MSTKMHKARRLELLQPGQVLRATYLQRMASIINDVVLNGPRDLDGGVEADVGEAVAPGTDGGTQTFVPGGNIVLEEQPDDAQYDIVSVPIVEADGEPAVEVRRQTHVVLIDVVTGRQYTLLLMPPDD